MSTTTATTTAKLFITDYASYNAGLQFVCGEWYDLTEFKNVNDLLAYVHDHYLSALGYDRPGSNNVEFEEYFSNLELMYTDFEGFPDSLYSESMNETELQNIIDFANLDDNEREKIDAFIDIFGGDFAQALDKYEDAYQGEFKNDEEFAEYMAESCGFEQPNAWPYNCIDWERAARDLMYDYSESNGFYFSSNW